MFDRLAGILMKLKKRGDIYVCFDIGHSSFREGEQSYYKGHRRSEMAKKSQAEQDEHAKFNSQYLSMIELFQLLPVHVLGVPGVEADDLASIVCLDFQKDPEVKVTLLTGDYDWFHMVVGTTNVRMYNFPDDSFIYSKNIIDTYGLSTRRQFSILKSIVGDKSDNIKFLRNLAKVKGQKVFEKIYETYNDPTDDQIIAIITDYIQDKPNIVLYEHHINDGRTTVEEAFRSNMKIADPFTTEDNMTEAQKLAFQECLSRSIPKFTNSEDFNSKSIELFGCMMVLNDTSKKVFKVE
jgi:5'-3' exonuclease